MKRISLEAAKTLLGTYEADLLACIKVAWTKWQTLVRPHMPMPMGRTLANVICQFAIDEARVRFDRVKGVRIHEKNGSFFLVFQETVVVRFKKVDSDLRTSNYPTERARALDAQAEWEQLELEGIPAHAPLLTLGYRPDRLTDDLRDVLVIYAVNRRSEWEYSLLNQAQAPVVQTLIPTPKQPGPRVKPKPGVVIPIKKKTDQKR